MSTGSSNVEMWRRAVIVDRSVESKSSGRITQLLRTSLSRHVSLPSGVDVGVNHST
jgi:hypothetical protein